MARKLFALEVTLICTCTVPLDVDTSGGSAYPVEEALDALEEQDGLLSTLLWDDAAEFYVDDIAWRLVEDPPPPADAPTPPPRHATSGRRQSQQLPLWKPQR